MNLYETYKNKLKQIKDLECSAAVLSWDQEVYMPSGGDSLRGEQLATLAGITHDLSVDPALGKVLDELILDTRLSREEIRNVKESVLDYKRRTKYTREFVEEQSKTISEAVAVWQKAKSANDYRIFEPLLQKIIGLKFKECDLLGYESHPYDAMLELHEPGARTADLDALFAGVRNELVGYVDSIRKRKPVDIRPVRQHFEKDKQWEVTLTLLRQMGYNFNQGRQDLSSHPFSISFGPTDARVTTRIDEQDLAESISSSIHEGGHALYDQGLLLENYGLPAGEAISLGVHESQSRLWENQVGRSLPYWELNFPMVQSKFPVELAGYTSYDFYCAMNAVVPGLIRTSADELTYHFHVMVRFEIEKEIFEGKLKIAELREFWNARYKAYLGIEVPDDRSGILQDIHWAHGSFGYFPTYSLGSFYAAQLFTAASKKIGDLDDQIRTGNFMPLLEWLRTHVHRYGRLKSSDELCRDATGEPLSFRFFMDYAKNKYGSIYQTANHGLPV